MVALRVIGTRCASSMTLRLDGGLLQSSSHAHSHRQLGAATVPASGMARTTPRMLRPAAVMRAGRHLIRPPDQSVPESPQNQRPASSYKYPRLRPHLAAIY